MKQFCKVILGIVLPLGLALQPVCRAEDAIVVSEGTRLKLQLNENLSTKENQEGDSFTAYVIESVYQGDQVVIPKASMVSGSISRITRPGRFKGKAVMHLLFQYIQIPGREKVSILASLVRIDADADIDAEGRLGGKGSTQKDLGKVIAPGLAGAGVGTIAGGGKGAGIGAGVGTGIGLANVFWTRGEDLELHRGSTVDISLEQALKIPVKSSR